MKYRQCNVPFSNEDKLGFAEDTDGTF